MLKSQPQKNYFYTLCSSAFTHYIARGMIELISFSGADWEWWVFLELIMQTSVGSRQRSIRKKELELVGKKFQSINYNCGNNSLFHQILWLSMPFMCQAHGISHLSIPSNKSESVRGKPKCAMTDNTFISSSASRRHQWGKKNN